MDTVLIIGRILFGGFFIIMGLNHFTKFTQMKMYTKSKRVPLPGLAVSGSAILLLLGGLSFLLWQYVSLGIILLVIFLFFTSIIMHQFWGVQENRQSRMIEIVNFLKNMAFIGALLIILVFVL